MSETMIGGGRSAITPLGRGGSMPARLAAAVAFVMMVAVNTLAVTLPINGVETNEVSARYDTLFAPAGFTFSIWGVIYTLLAVYTVYQLIRVDETIAAVTNPYVGSSVLNSLWILTWHYELIWLSAITMIGILVMLIRIGTILARRRFRPVDWFILQLPFSVYFGWISVATVANISAFLVSLGWRGSVFSEEIWTVITLVVAAAIGLTTMFVNRDPAYGLVFVWAFWGILARHRSADGWDRAYDLVLSVVPVLIVALALGVAVAARRYFGPGESRSTTSVSSG